MSGWLKALALVAPGAAMKRARALAAIEAVRGYEGASRGRRAASFGGRDTSANVEVGGALHLLRDRSRDMVRNTWAGARILDVFVSHAVGTGMTAVPATGSARLDRQVTALWEEFVAHSDIEGELDFHGQTALAVRAMLEGGEALARFVPRRLNGPRFPLALQLLEGDFIDTGRDGALAGSGRRSRLGVGLGEWNERAGYWLFDQHPGEMTGVAKSAFVRRSEVIHLYRPLRPGQVRGVPAFAPVIMAARDLHDLMDAIVVKTRIEACFAAFVTSPDGGPMTAPISQTQRERIEELRPGMVSYLNEGEEISFAAPSGSGQFEPVMLSALQAMAAGAGITYDQLTGDLRQANYSSLRAGKIEFRRIVEQLQWLVIVPMFLNRTWERFIETAILAGRLRPREQGYPVEWVMPGVEPIDPKKDLEADILAVRAGRMSPQEFIAAWGRDWRKVVADYSEFLKTIDETGIVLDIDPRRMSRGGQGQAVEPDNAAAIDGD